MWPFSRVRHDSASARFDRALDRAAQIQRLGYDIGFSYLPRFPDMPLLHVCAGRFQKEELLGSGFDCLSSEDAFIKALSETVERAVWREDELFWKEDSVEATTEQMRERAISLERFAGFSRAQRDADQRLRYDSSTPFLYSSAQRLSDGKPIFVPAQLISGAYSARMREPLLRMPNSNGLATHESFDGAARRGLLELIERDAFMITFWNQISAPRIDTESLRDPRTQSLLERLRSYALRVDLVSLPTDMPVHVIAAVLHDESGEGPAFVLGARAHENAEEAVYGALTEALGVYYLARLLGLYRTALPQGPLTAIQRIALWAKPEEAPHLDWLTAGESKPCPPRQKELSAASLARAAEARGCQVAAILMTPPKLRSLGLQSVCAVSPELQPLNLDSEPIYLGGERLQSVPEALGYTAKDAPPPYPHPFP